MFSPNQSVPSTDTVTNNEEDTNNLLYLDEEYNDDGAMFSPNLIEGLVDADEKISATSSVADDGGDCTFDDYSITSSSVSAFHSERSGVITGATGANNVADSDNKSVIPNPNIYVKPSEEAGKLFIF
jgi:hypothetical protein